MADLTRVIHFTNVRVSFPNIIEPQKQQTPDGERISYNAAFLMLPTDPNFAKFMHLINQIAVEKWKEQAPLVMAHVQRDTKGRCYAQGEEKVNSKTLKPYDGYAGNIVISAGNKVMPQMVDAQGAPVDPANTMAYQAIARKMYAGSRVNVALKPWLQENKHGRAIRCELVALQFATDDTPFGEGHVDVTGMFAPTAPADVAPGFAAAPWMAPVAPTAPTNPFAAPAAPNPFAAPVAAPVWAPPATSRPSFM
jgi:hypothetical protein